MEAIILVFKLLFAIVGGILINKTTEAGGFEFIKRHLRTTWLIFLFLTVVVFVADPLIWGIIMKLNKSFFFSDAKRYGVLFILGGFLLCSLYWVSGLISRQPEHPPVPSSDSQQVVASPSEITMVRHTRKDIVLSITNNKDFTIFDMCLSICVSDEMLIPSLIRIEPLVKEYLPNYKNISGTKLTFSNKCLALFFGGVTGLHAHTTKDYFRITIDADNVTKDLKVAFDMYNWSREPSMFSVPTTSDKFPNNLNELLDRKSGKQGKTKMIVTQSIKTPINKYFPDEKTYKIIEMGYF